MRIRFKLQFTSSEYLFFMFISNSSFSDEKNEQKNKIKNKKKSRKPNSMPFLVLRWGSFAVHIGDQFRFGIICGPIWGSFPVWASFAVGDHLRRCTVLEGFRRFSFVLFLNKYFLNLHLLTLLLPFLSDQLGDTKTIRPFALKPMSR